MISAYKACVRPFLAGSCKFHPTCSDYAMEAFQIHGLRRGLWLTVRRLLRCHPFALGGFDPVPSGDEPGATTIVGDA
jgi:hypothetical protein